MIGENVMNENKGELNFRTIQLGDIGEIYKHLIQDKTLYIERDGDVILTLSPDEIMSMLKALGINRGDFSNGYFSND
jgi:hypothetical protein